MGIEIKGLEQLIKNYDRRSNAVDVAGIVNQGATIVQAQAKALAPKDTGALIQSIGVDKALGGTSATASVATDKEYAAYQEYGTSKMAAQPYMRPAALIAKPKVNAYAIAQIKKAMK